MSKHEQEQYVRPDPLNKISTVDPASPWDRQAWLRTEKVQLIQQSVKEKQNRFRPVSQKQLHRTKQLDRYVQVQHEYFASKHGVEHYETQMRASMERMESQRRKNLYALVMPSGTGKTTLTDRYGCILDVDDLVSNRIHNELYEERKELIHSNQTWKGHNDKWYAAVRDTLSMMDVSKPLVLLVHHEYMAMEIGAKIIGGIQMTDSGHEASIGSRTYDAKALARLNRVLTQKTFTYTPYVAEDHEGVERAFLAYMNVNHLPVGAPYKYSRSLLADGYSPACPSWATEGRVVEGMTIHTVVELYEGGHVPKECVDYYIKKFRIPAAYGFGMTMNDWAKLMAKFADAIGEKQIIDTNEYADANEIFPFASNREMTRANMTIRRLIKVFDIWSHPDCVDIASHHKGERNVFVTSILLAWKGLFIKSDVHDLVFPWLRINATAWPKLMKELHVAVRTSNYVFNRKISEADRQNLMYLELLVGREDYDLTTDMALAGRTKSDLAEPHVAYDPNTGQWTNERYKVLFLKAISSSHSKVQQKPKQVFGIKSFKDFYSNRKIWLTKGGLGVNDIDPRKKKYTTYVLDDMMGTINELESRHDKGSFFEMHDLVDVIDRRKDMFNSTRYLKKFETGGKHRVLLPGSLMHYIVFTYVLHIAERQEQIGSVRLNAPNDDDMIYFDGKMESSLHHLLYDWANFNEQHSPFEMAAVINKLAEVIPTPLDYSYFAGVIAGSMYNMKLIDGDGNLHNLEQGLFSGWRGTTWINSVLNDAYINVALQVMVDIYGRNSLKYIDHGGDDVDIAMLEPEDALRFLYVMDAMKFDATAAKQMLGQRSEFFRVTITGEGIYASATRALSSVVAGDWEGDNRQGVAERVTSTLDQLGQLQRRGMDAEVVKGMAIATLSHWCRIHSGDEWLDLPDEIFYGRVEDGGLGIPDENGQVWKLDRIVTLTKDTFGRKLPAGTKASTDYVLNLASEVQSKGLQLVNTRQLIESMAVDQFKFSENADHVDWQSAFNEKYNVVGKEDVIKSSWDVELLQELFSFDTRRIDEGKYDLATKYGEIAGYLQSRGKKMCRDDVIQLVSNGSVNPEAIDFAGNMYYRRLVSSPWGYRITKLCREKINEGYWDKFTARENFETMCYMISKVYPHRF